MGSALRAVVPFGSALGLILACSSTNEESPYKAPLPPSGGSRATGGSAATGGGGSTSGGSGTSGGTAGTGTGMACKAATECTGVGFACKDGQCTCPTNVPEICGTGAESTCVNKQVDPDNCGDCGKKCDAGSACVAGACGPTPKDVTTGTGCGAIRMVIQGTSLYWTELTSGKVRSMPLAGGPATDIATGQTAPTQIVADAEAVYWINQADVAGMSKIYKRKLSGGGPVNLKTVALGAEGKVPAIAVLGDKLYYATSHYVHAISTDETKTGDDVVGIAVDLDTSTEKGDPSGLSVKGTTIIWTTAGRQGVEADDIDAMDDNYMGYVELGQSQGGLLLPDIAQDATYAYWANGANFLRNKLAAEDPVPDPAITSTPALDAITAFAINATDVYAAAERGFVIKHSLLPPSDPKDEKTIVAPSILARDQTGVSSVVVDGTNVYWATGDCAIRSTPL